jgi:hypothetical protein
MRLGITAVLALVVGTTAPLREGGAAGDEAPRVAVADMLEDVRLLREALDELHPGLHWYTPEVELTRAFDDAVAQIRAPLTEGELRAIVQPAVALIRCGHTYLLTSSAHDEWLDRQPAELLPFRLWVDGDRLHVLSNGSSDPSIQPGDQLEVVNGVPVREIIRRARALVSADGYQNTMKDIQLNYGGATYVRELTFHGLGLRPPYALRVVRPGGPTFATTVTRAPRRDGGAGDAGAQPAPPAASPQPPPMRSFEILSPGVARLTLRGFVGSGAADFHRSTFAEIEARQIRHLILDLRENPGGNGDDADDLMKYLMDRPFITGREQWAKVRHPESPTFARHLDPRTKRLLLDNNRFRRSENGRHVFDYVGGRRHQPARAHRYGGALYLLVGGRTFSSAALLAVSLVTQRPVTVIGQETGGGQAGCSAGINHTLTLPRTGLRLRLPVFRLRSAHPGPNHGRGLVPDHVIQPTWQDIAARRDLELAKALALIAAGSTPPTRR